MSKECYDHLGNKFKSIKDMLKYYNISAVVYYDRLKEGKMTLEEILLTPVNTTRKECIDHLGYKYRSVEQMCHRYGIKSSVFNYRIKRGMSLQEALTTKNLRECIDHLGNKFKSQAEMCKHYNISENSFYDRINSGWTLKDTLTTKSQKGQSYICSDHLGNTFGSEKEMCDAYKTTIKMFRARLKLGWTVEDALTKPKASERIEDTFGNRFESIKKLAMYYGIRYDTLRNRLEKGLKIGEALGIEGIGIDVAIKNKETINTHIHNIKKAYKGARTGKIYYTCTDITTGEELLMNADEMLIYKQKDYKTAVEQLIARRRGVYNG